MDKKLLEEIGLTKSEINVYLALLELGSSSTGKIVEKSKASSSKIYEILDKLIQKGLVSFIVKSGVKYFEAASPERIMDYMKEKEEKFNEQKQELRKLIPELELKRTLSKYKSEATIFKGIKGGETAFKHLINSMAKKDEWIGFIVSFTNRRYFNLLTRLHEWRVKKGLKSRIIFNERAREDGKVREKLSLTKIKYVPDELQTPAIVNVAGDITLINIMGEEVTVFMIENKTVADSFKHQFEKLWKQEVFTYNGQEAVESAYSNLLDKATKKDDIVIFAAKPATKRGSDYNRDWNREIRKKVKDVRLLYYGDSPENRARAKEIAEQGCETRILPTKEILPISNVVVGNTILSTVWDKHPVAFVIKNKAVADSFRANFDFLWDKDVNVYRGFKDVTNKFMLMLDLYEEGEEYYVLGATYGLGGKKLRDWFMDYSKYRIKKKVKGKFLLVPEDYQETLREFKIAGDTGFKYSETKKLSPEFSTPMQINLYKGNKVLMFLWGEEMMCFEVESEILYNNFKTYFDSLWKQETKIVRGLDAIQNIFEEMLETGSTDFIGARGYFVDQRPEYISGWEKRAIKKGFKMRNVVDPGTKGHLITKFPFAQTKYTLSKEFSNLSVFWIYGNKVVISNWMEKEPFAVVIENKHLHSMYKEQFELLWKTGKK